MVDVYTDSTHGYNILQGTDIPLTATFKNKNRYDDIA